MRHKDNVNCNSHVHTMLDYVDSVLNEESHGYCLTDVYLYAREDGEDGNAACEVEINRVLTAPSEADIERSYLLWASNGQDDGSF